MMASDAESPVAARRPLGQDQLLGGAFLAIALAAACVPFVHVLPRESCWLAFALGGAFGTAGVLAWRGAAVAALLALILFLGGIGQLAQTDADWFSEFHPNAHGGQSLATLALIALEAVAALAVLWGRWATPVRALVRRAGVLRCLVLVVLIGFFSTSVMRYVGLHQPAGFVWRVAALGLLASVHLVLVAALALAPDLPRVWPAARTAEAWSRRAPWLLAAGVVFVSSVLALLAFRRMGLVEDETAYLFQARTFAHGALRAPPLPADAVAALRFYLIPADASGWYAATAPGWPAALTLGVLAGVPWLVNPLLGGIAVLLSHRLVERWSDRATANLVVLLMATSPWLLETTASMMTHALSLALIAGSWLLLTRAGDRQDADQPWRAAGLAFAAGLLMGWLFLNRSLEGVLIGGFSGLWLVWRVRLGGWRAIVLYGAGCLGLGALFFAYNYAFTGKPLLDPLNAYLGALWGRQGNVLGFGPNVGPPSGWGETDLWPGHSPLEGLINTQISLRTMNAELFGWPFGSLGAILAWLLWGDRSRALPRTMLVLAAVVIFVHFFYWFTGVFYVGPRYWYAAFLPLVIVSAFGVRGIVSGLDRAGVDAAQPRVFVTVMVLAAFALTAVVPWRGIEKYGARSSVGAALARLAERPALANTVIFVSDNTFQRAAILNDPWLLPGRPIFLRDHGSAANARALAAFPGRHAVRAWTVSSSARP